MSALPRLLAAAVIGASHVCAFAAPPNALTPELAAQGWISLFDGSTLFGWTSTEPDVNWIITDGAITASTGPVGFLVTNAAFSDYRLHVEFRAEAGANGGVFLHTGATPRAPGQACYEVNIAPEDNPFPTGSIVARQKRAATGNAPPCVGQLARVRPPRRGRTRRGSARRPNVLPVRRPVAPCARQDRAAAQSGRCRLPKHSSPAAQDAVPL